MDRLGLPRDVERVDRDRPVAELLAGAGVLGEDDHAVALVDERRLLRDEVQPVGDRVHEQHVVLLVRGDRPREVVLDLEADRQPALAAEPVVDGARRVDDRVQVGRVLRDVLSRRYGCRR